MTLTTARKPRFSISLRLDPDDPIDADIIAALANHKNKAGGVCRMLTHFLVLTGQVSRMVGNGHQAHQEPIEKMEKVSGKRSASAGPPAAVNQLPMATAAVPAPVASSTPQALPAPQGRAGVPVVIEAKEPTTGAASGLQDAGEEVGALATVEASAEVATATGAGEAGAVISVSDSDAVEFAGLVQQQVDQKAECKGGILPAGDLMDDRVF